jgi:hypothetical protein
VVAAVSAAAAVCTFAFRFLAFRGLPNDQYMHLAWARQLLDGALPGRDFWEPGMPLAIALSAAVQAYSPGPFSEGVMSMTALALAAGATCFVVARASGSMTAAIAAALLQLVLHPRFYSYPKIVVPAVAMLLLYSCVRRPAAANVLLLAAWVVVGFLLRHDLGVIAAMAVLTGLGTLAVPASARLRAAGQFVGAGLLLVMPYLLYLQWAEGLVEHVRVGLEFGRADAHQLLLWTLPPLPRLDALAGPDVSTEAAAQLLFWLTHMAIAALSILTIRRRHDPTLFPLLVATLTFTIAYRLVILRHPIVSRLPDLASVVALAVGWCTASLLTHARTRWRVAPASALAGAAAVPLLVLPFIGGSVALGRIGDELDETQLLRGLNGVRSQARGVIEAATHPDWDAYWPAGDVPLLVRYLRECTNPDHKTLLTWSAPEFYYFARRPFAAGHALLLPGSFASEADQRRMLQRLEREFVPVVLVNDSRRDEFDRAFPMVASYVRERYDVRGSVVIKDGSRVEIAARRELAWDGTFADEQWPCMPRVATSW